MGPGERKGLLGNALPTSNTIHVKEEMSEDSFNANGELKESSEIQNDFALNFLFLIPP